MPQLDPKSHKRVSSQPAILCPETLHLRRRLALRKRLLVAGWFAYHGAAWFSFGVVLALTVGAF